MLNDEIEKKINLKNRTKNPSQPGLDCLTCDSS